MDHLWSLLSASLPYPSIGAPNCALPPLVCLHHHHRSWSRVCKQRRRCTHQCSWARVWGKRRWLVREDKRLKSMKVWWLVALDLQWRHLMEELSFVNGGRGVLPTPPTISSTKYATLRSLHNSWNFIFWVSGSFLITLLNIVCLLMLLMVRNLDKWIDHKALHGWRWKMCYVFNHILESLTTFSKCG